VTETHEQTVLVDPDAPLERNGSVLSPKGGTLPSASEFVEIKSNSEVQRRASETFRKLADIPTERENLNAVSIVLAYTLMGISEQEISDVTGLSVEQIGNIKMLDAYTYSENAVIDRLIKEDTDDVRKMIAQHSRNAVNRIAHLSQHSEFDAVQLKASQDILDRAGHRPVDIVEHRHKMDDDLRIQVIEERKVEGPQIDLQVVEIEDA
jgi:DNA-binding helix-hairpin-helix protein with protein kinase domain